MNTHTPDHDPDARDAVGRRDRLTKSLRALRRIQEGGLAADIDELVALTGLPHPGTADVAVALDALIQSAEDERARVNRQIRGARALSSLRVEEAAPRQPSAVSRPPDIAQRSVSPLIDEAARLGKMNADDLDGLPYGAILLDATGRVLGYNDTESRMARLPVEAVVGRNFFSEVAPCTRVKEFEGRFRALAGGGGPQVATFDFTFPFQFGPQRVSVLLTRGAAAGTVVMALVRR